MSSPNIAIVGAGPGGLILAILLQKRGIPVTIYEKEISDKHRSQGGSLDLHEESGILALREAGLLDQFKAVARYEDQGFRLYDKNGRMYINQVTDVNDGGHDGANDRPEIDRVQLRNILLNAVYDDTIVWGRKVTTVTERNDGRLDVSFDGHPSVTADLVVGADGAWSRIRPLLTDIRPEYTNCSMVEVSFTNVDSKHPSLAQLVGRGILIAGSANKALVAQRNGGNNIKNYITLRVPETWTKECSIDFTNPSVARKSLLGLFEDWDEKLKELISLCDDSFTPRALYALPIGHKWASKKNLTLIGDAAHLMTPFAGEGVNLAMGDALNLANALVKYPNDMATAILEYETEMFERVKGPARRSSNNLNLTLAEDAPKGFVEVMSQFMPPEAVVRNP